MLAPGSLVSIAEAAARKGVHYETVRRAIARGDLKALKVGGGVVISPDDLEGWQPNYLAARPHREGRQLRLL